MTPQQPQPSSQMLKENYCRRRIVRAVRKDNTQKKNITALKSNLVGLPFHLSPRPMFSPMMDSLLCDIINHSRVQRGTPASTSPVLILNEPWDDHRKKMDKRRREPAKGNIPIGKTDELRPASVCAATQRCAKRRRVVSPQELASVSNQVERLSVGKTEMASCALPPAFSIGSNSRVQKLSAPASVKDAHILAFRRDMNTNIPTFEDLELSSTEESVLNQAFGKLAMDAMQKQQHTRPLITEITP